MKKASLRVAFAGPLVTYQDGGRPGKMRFGVPASGPMDRLALKAANVALGNPPNSTAVEVSIGGLVLKCTEGAVSLAIAGGSFLIDRAGERLGNWTVFALQKGETLTVRAGKKGSWTYLAFAGDVIAPKWLDHTATHSASGFGGGQLMSGGDIQVVNAQVREDRHGDISRPGFPSNDHNIRVVQGPQDRFFKKESIETFLSQSYALTSSFDRMGVRLSGPKLELAGALSIPSEPILVGSVQVAGDGVPTVLLADHQTTGGYPKIATVITDDLDKLSQKRAGDHVKFEPVSAETALQITRANAKARTTYLADIAVPKGSLSQRLMRDNLISGAISAHSDL
ncbi:biotin-dependent carboxyltransferase family protein [Shimia sp.]|uniref:5-oxoprolinase subunit C family protein n=1 Tax=Shimia sp. TaxID=1954381 RepID=UPI00329A3B71